MAFPSMTFFSELDPVTRKELLQFYSLIEGFLRSAGFREDGSFKTITISTERTEDTPQNGSGIAPDRAVLFSDNGVVTGADGAEWWTRGRFGGDGEFVLRHTGRSPTRLVDSGGVRPGGGQSHLWQYDPDYFEMALNAAWHEDIGRYESGTNGSGIAWVYGPNFPDPDPMSTDLWPQLALDLYGHAPGEAWIAGNKILAQFLMGGLVDGEYQHGVFTMKRRKMETGNKTGTILELDRNSAGDGAASALRLQNRDGGLRYIWQDENGQLRKHELPPTEDDATTTPDNAGQQVSPYYDDVVGNAFAAFLWGLEYDAASGDYYSKGAGGVRASTTLDAFADAPIFSIETYKLTPDTLTDIEAGARRAFFSIGGTVDGSYQHGTFVFGGKDSATGTGASLVPKANLGGAGAASMVTLEDRSGGQFHLWVDNAGKLRIGTSAPNAGSAGSDTGGTIVGTQT